MNCYEEDTLSLFNLSPLATHGILFGSAAFARWLFGFVGAAVIGYEFTEERKKTDQTNINIIIVLAM